MIGGIFHLPPALFRVDDLVWYDYNSQRARRLLEYAGGGGARAHWVTVWVGWHPNMQVEDFMTGTLYQVSRRDLKPYINDHLTYARVADARYTWYATNSIGARDIGALTHTA